MITIPMMAKYGRTKIERTTLSSMTAVSINSRFARAISKMEEKLAFRLILSSESNSLEFLLLLFLIYPIIFIIAYPQKRINK